MAFAAGTAAAVAATRSPLRRAKRAAVCGAPAAAASAPRRRTVTLQDASSEQPRAEDVQKVRNRLEDWKREGSLESRRGENDFPGIPQTIEYAVRCAQTATAFSFIDDVTRVIVDLPLGRRRSDGLRWATAEHNTEQSNVLVMHYCEGFQGARVRLIVAQGALPRHVPWIGRVDRLSDAVQLHSAADFDVVVIASATSSHAAMVNEVIEGCARPTAVVLFNCFDDAELREALDEPHRSEFEPVYVCRRYGHGCAFRRGHGRPWDVYAEVSIFEFEHVAAMEPSWAPTQRSVLHVLKSSDQVSLNRSGYYDSSRQLKFAGFWPFMIIAFPDVLPLEEGTLMPQPNRKKKRFGFF